MPRSIMLDLRSKKDCHFSIRTREILYQEHQDHVQDQVGDMHHKILASRMGRQPNSSHIEVDPIRVKISATTEMIPSAGGPYLNNAAFNF